MTPVPLREIGFGWRLREGWEFFSFMARRRHERAAEAR